MPIKYNYEVSVNDNKAKLNKDIFLFRGNRNIHYYFSIKGARFTFSKENEDLLESSNAIYAAVTVVKPNGVEVANAIAPVEDGLIHLKVTEDLIDEEVEVGDFDLVFDLFDDSDGAVTIPKIKGQFHVQERPCTTSIGTLSGNVNVVNQAVVDLAIATQENEQLIVVDDDGKYVKTTWAKGNKISVERLNKMEEGIYNNSSQLKDIANLSLAIGGDGLLYIKKQDGTLIGTGVKVGSDTDLSKVTMSVNGNTLKLLNDGTQIAAVDLPVGSSEVPDNTVMYEEDDESIENAINAENIVIKDIDNNFTATHVEGALKELFQSASNGKTLIANAITGKGVATNVSDSFQTMATNIKNISSGSGGGGITPTGTKEITQNGTYDVTNFAAVLVNVASTGGTTGSGDNIESGTITPTKQSTDIDIPTTKKCSNIIFFQHEMNGGAGYRTLAGLIRCGGVGINLASNSTGTTLNMISASGTPLTCVVVTFTDNNIHIYSDANTGGGGYLADKQYDWYAW